MSPTVSPSRSRKRWTSRLTAVLSAALVVSLLNPGASGVASASLPGEVADSALSVGQVTGIVDLTNPAILNTAGPGIYPWGENAAATPTLTIQPQADVPDHGTIQSLRVSATRTSATNWGGISYETAASQDWSAYDGFGFWFKGQASGKVLQYELKMTGNSSNSTGLYVSNVTDDSANWKLVRVLWRDLVRKSGNTGPVTPDPSKAWGFALTLTASNIAYDYRYADFHIFQRSNPIESFEGASPITAATPGLFPWQNSGDLPVLSVATVGGNKVLTANYSNLGSRGFAQEFAATADWSDYRGLGFKWDGSGSGAPTTAPLPVVVQLLTGGTGPGTAELWQSSFSNNTEGLQQQKFPFNAFTVSQGSPTPAGSAPDLTKVWGYRVTFPASVSGSFYFDDLALYGTKLVPGANTITSPKPFVSVDKGGVAQIPFLLTTSNGQPSAAAVTVSYSTNATGTAVAGTHFTALTNATVTFPANSPSGTTRNLALTTLSPATTSDVARTVVGTATVTGGTISGAPATVAINAYGFPYLNSTLSAEDRAADLVGRLNLAEKVGQMTQADRANLTNPAPITNLGLGSVLSGGGSVPANNTAAGWADMVDNFQLYTRATRFQIPIVYGVDAVHGHNNLVGATIFPHNIGLGATRNPAVVEQTGAITASEVRATGIQWTFAPCLCVTRDERWGRSYESFGEDPALVSTMAPIVTGYQGSNPNDLSGPDKVLATIKHWVGDGATTYNAASTGYKIDQGVTNMSEADLRRLAIDPYIRPSPRVPVRSCPPTPASTSATARAR